MIEDLFKFGKPNAFCTRDTAERRLIDNSLQPIKTQNTMYLTKQEQESMQTFTDKKFSETAKDHCESDKSIFPYLKILNAHITLFS